MSKNAKKKRANQIIKKHYLKEENILYLPSEKLDCHDLQLIAKESTLQGLNSVKLSNNTIGPCGAQFLVQANWINLTNLQLKNCNLGHKGLKILLKGNWERLIQLRLGFNRLNNQGMYFLSQSNWQMLQKLWLQGNHIGMEGVQRLTNLQAPALQHIRDNKLDFESVKQISKFQLNSIKNIEITNIGCSAFKGQRIRQIISSRFPNITLEQ